MADELDLVTGRFEEQLQHSMELKKELSRSRVLKLFFGRTFRVQGSLRARVAASCVSASPGLVAACPPLQDA